MSTAAEKILRKPNPYDALLETFWQVLESDTDFCSVVPSGNRIKFMGADREPVKRDISEADIPEVRVIVTGSAPHPKRTSSSHSDTVTLEIQVSSGDQRFSAMHNPLRWILFRALRNIEDELRRRCFWNGENPVKLAKPTQVRDGVSQSDLDRGIKGWSAMWTCEIELWFGRDL